jgi:hypothetical protein
MSVRDAQLVHLVRFRGRRGHEILVRPVIVGGDLNAE